VKTIGKHVANARREELADESTVAKFATVQQEGDRAVERNIEHYNLDMVLSIGYRVKSPEGIRFRRWANDVLKRYVLAGVATNETRLREIGTVVRMLERSDDAEVATAPPPKSRPPITLTSKPPRQQPPPSKNNRNQTQGESRSL
jgi:hypothetical protein